MQALWMVLAAFFFASMGVCVKLASAHFNTAEIVLYRGLVGLLLMGAVLWLRGTAFRSPVPGMHAWRCLVGTLALGAWFYAISQLPLATAMTLNYMSGVWIAAFVVGGAVLYGASSVQGPLLATVLAGFVGVLLMLRPTIEQNQVFAGLVGLLSGIATALAYVQVTALGKAGEPEERTVFYFAAGSALAGLLALAFTGTSTWHWPSALWLLPIGVLATLGQWCMTRAYSKGSTLVVASLQYTGIVFAAFYSLAVFGDQLSATAWLGMALIVASGVAATVLRLRAIPNTPAEDH
ncbi:MAG: DMT family transporter [Burkholderiales bacterium]